MAISTGAVRLLDSIEAIELRSLEWGYTDGSLREDDVRALANSVCANNNGDVLVEELIDSKLIFELPSIGSDLRIRSRFAEMMRLLSANRQLFPNKPWQNAPSLVADFRVDRRPRRFPRRDREPSAVLEAHDEIIGTSTLRRDLWHALTARPGLKLAAFQERATVRLSAPPDNAGTIVTAGTGSGKTIAVYLPAMLRIGEAITDDHWVKTLAVYPRIELLKDQLGEAFRMARSIDAPLAAQRRRPLLIGALFRATPEVATRAALEERKWLRRGTDFICPWLRCPLCNGELLWSHADLEAAREQLTCAQHTCPGRALAHQIVLTRRRLQRQPPDILFTTTEILNQRLSDQWMRIIFGVGAQAARKPFLALLDEVHTYEGAAGAQAALTLKRWHHLLAAPINWVGLSATIRDAARFFAELTGTDPDRVIEITPNSDEYIEEGAEYQVVLRGDPTSRASLLSTTIQTSMLLPRILDPPGHEATPGAFGRRVFLFTDDLDVTNRLYDDLRDAEAYTIFGAPDQSRLPLASLRQAGSDAVARDMEGQRWRICEDIGHPLGRRLIIGRTTSQDAGVNQEANIVVATSSLEVGYNDPLVGAVIQHKAPRGMASFLQRKGRAGRYREMRPITVTVLSDYGRDRALYQTFEQLFDPLLEPQYLPTRNPYVLKIQATFALFDWLAARTSGYEKAWMWNVLSRPLVNPSTEVKNIVNAVKKILTQLVQGEEATITDLRAHLTSALSVDETTAQSLLWEAPRSLLLEAVPTLVRRLFRQWQMAFPTVANSRDLQIDFHPLPDFIPRSLFSELSLPEVRIIVPPATVNHEERIEAMPILQALNQLVPGRVTRRFAPERGALSHWVAVDPAIPEQHRRISDYAEEYEFVGTFKGRYNDIDERPLVVFRPWTVRLVKAARSDALPSSNARLSWLTDIVPNGDPLSVAVPLRSQWRAYLQSVDFYLHRFRSSVSVRRFAPIVHANIRKLRDEFPVTLHFMSDDDQPAAVGFELEVDGFRLELSLPAASEFLTTSDLPTALANSSRLAYLRDTFRSDTRLPVDLNRFQRDWLFQTLTAALLSDAASTDRAIDVVAAELLDDAQIDETFRKVMDELFGAIPPDPQLDNDASEADETDNQPVDGAAIASDPRSAHSSPSRLQQTLANQLHRPVVRERLRALVREFVAPNATALGAWLRRLLVETLGGAVLQACIASAPRHSTVDNLLVDIRDNEKTGVATVWITEATLGGAGVLQAFAERFALEPRLFFSAVEAALMPTDLELVDNGLREILALAANDANVIDHLARLRATDSHNERARVWQSLSHMLASRGGIDLSHALSVSLNKRLLRAGSGPELDRLLLDLQRYWDEVEGRFGLSVGLSEFAFVCSKNDRLSKRIRDFLATTLPSAVASHLTVLAAVTSLLWPREAELRQKSLQSYSAFRQARTTDPAIVRHLLLTRSMATVELSEPEWRERLRTELEARGECNLVANANEAAALRQALVQLVATPLDVGFLQFFPVVDRLEKSAGRLLAGLTLREQV